MSSREDSALRSSNLPVVKGGRRPRRYLRSRYTDDLQIFSTLIQRTGIFLLLVAIVVFPFMADDYLIYVVNLAGLAIISAHGLNFLTGYTGQVSLAHASFMAIGAYVSGIAFIHGVPLPLAVILGAVLAAGAGLIVALPALRLKGLYLAMATLAFQFIITFIITNWTSVTGGSAGMSLPKATILGYRLSTDRQYYWLIIGMVVIATMVAINLHRSRFGRGFFAVRDRDLAAGALGISVTGHKLMAFSLSAVFAAVSGSIYGFYAGYIGADNFTLLHSIEYLAMIIVGGMGTVLGGIFGAIFMTVLPEALRLITSAVAEFWPTITGRFGDVRTIAYGVVIIASLMYAPDGMAGLWRDIRLYFRQWPFSY